MRALDRHEPRPVVVFAGRGEVDQIEAAIEAGVGAYVVEVLQPSRVRPVLEVAIHRFRAVQALRVELERTRSTLAELILIERAKGVLMQRRRLSEAEAHRLTRRMAMKRRQRIAHIAQAILSTNGHTEDRHRRPGPVGRSLLACTHFSLAASHKNDYENDAANAAATERSPLVFAPVGSADQRRPATPEIGGVAPWSLAFVPYASATCR